ncbi:MAG: hypothetical protein H0T89_02420 [Deltaproteobacteria bacterium]|nr:hypothetical protein [Deltaproteobacteria bacterium]MDQ3296453.1 hypothetical protein [Myxococcota bacterium]
MRTSSILAFLVFTACGGGPDIGGPCDLEDLCDDGATCNLSAADGDGRSGTCIANDGDIDGDGLRNDKDFCNAIPGGTYDEDLDGVGDDCDRCPIARPLAAPDSDGDEVDGPCDPDPSVAGDRIVLFEGFNATLPSGWKMVGNWEFRGGEVVATPPDGTTIGTLTAPLPLVTTRMAVLAQYRIDRVDAAAAQSLVGVTAIDRRPAGVSAVTCGGQRAGAADSLLLDTDTGAAAKPFANLFDTASRYRIAQKIEGIQAACSMIADAEQGAVGQTTGGEAPSEAGLLARAATARFQYLLVVQRPPS